MSKRKRESTSGMHPSNPYSNTRPDFVELSERFPTLRPFVTVKGSGASARGVIDFHNPLALRELTYCLLKKDFSIELDIPLDSLCPTVPNRLNYICWMEDLMNNDSERDITGIDIWYTSMLGKRSSVDKITAYLKDKEASTKQMSNKMVKLAPPKTVLTFEEMDVTPAEAEERCKEILARLMIDHDLEKANFPGQSEAARVLHARTSRNTWSRAARRALARESKISEESGTADREPFSDPAAAPILEFDIRINACRTKNKPKIAKEETPDTLKSTSGVSVALTWTMGQDRTLFESFFLHFRSAFGRY
ncbi:hypothetical protein EC968_002798 [Mortierella alpina]|nr:hypothetical protein EC968_002798 [Mortierella alpina]